MNGDNYYKTKTSAPNDKGYIKTDDMTTVDRGFDILKKFPKQIYLTIGNHEVDNKTPCQTLLKEIETIKDSQIQLPHNYYSLNISNTAGHKVKIVLLDVNLFDKNVCYEDDSRSEKKSIMLNWLVEHCKSTPVTTPIIIVGHYPLFSLEKEKEKKNKNKQSSDETNIFQFTMNHFMKDVFEILKSYDKRQFIYLASDSHNYQKIEHSNILQYISGTGGADLDNIENFYANNLTKPNIYIIKNDPVFSDISEPFIIHTTSKTHGYMIIKVRDVCTFDFFAISIGGSLEKKYCKYVNKNIKLQKIICS